MKTAEAEAEACASQGRRQEALLTEETANGASEVLVSGGGSRSLLRGWDPAQPGVVPGVAWPLFGLSTSESRARWVFGPPCCAWGSRPLGWLLFAHY